MGKEWRGKEQVSTLRLAISCNTARHGRKAGSATLTGMPPRDHKSRLRMRDGPETCEQEGAINNRDNAYAHCPQQLCHANFRRFERWVSSRKRTKIRSCEMNDEKDLKHCCSCHSLAHKTKPPHAATRNTFRSGWGSKKHLLFEPFITAQNTHSGINSL